MLLNAAMCYRDLSSFVPALTLVQEAIAVREDIATSAGARAGSGGGSLALAKELRADLLQLTGTDSAGSLSSTKDALFGGAGEKEEDEEEWEECQEGEEGCEAFYVYVDDEDTEVWDAGDDKDDDGILGERKAEDDNRDADADEDEDEEEDEEELREIRARYAEQTARWRNMQSGSVPPLDATQNLDRDAELKAIREELAALQRAVADAVFRLERVAGSG